MTQAQIPPKVVKYMRTVGVDVLDVRDQHPVIEQVFIPGRGWVRYGFNKRVSGAWARRHLIPEGVTHVALRFGSHLADFSVRELTS